MHLNRQLLCPLVNQPLSSVCDCALPLVVSGRADYRQNRSRRSGMGSGMAQQGPLEPPLPTAAAEEALGPLYDLLNTVEQVLGDGETAMEGQLWEEGAGEGPFESLDQGWEIAEEPSGLLTATGGLSSENSQASGISSQQLPWGGQRRGGRDGRKGGVRGPGSIREEEQEELVGEEMDLVLHTLRAMLATAQEQAVALTAVLQTHVEGDIAAATLAAAGAGMHNSSSSRTKSSTSGKLRLAANTAEALRPMLRLLQMHGRHTARLQEQATVAAAAAAARDREREAWGAGSTIAETSEVWGEAGAATTTTAAAAAVPGKVSGSRSQEACAQVQQLLKDFGKAAAVLGQQLQLYGDRAADCSAQGAPLFASGRAVDASNGGAAAGGGVQGWVNKMLAALQGFTQQVQQIQERTNVLAWQQQQHRQHEMVQQQRWGQGNGQTRSMRVTLGSNYSRRTTEIGDIGAAVIGEPRSAAEAAAAGGEGLLTPEDSGLSYGDMLGVEGLQGVANSVMLAGVTGDSSQFGSIAQYLLSSGEAAAAVAAQQQQGLQAEKSSGSLPYDRQAFLQSKAAFASMLSSSGVAPPTAAGASAGTTARAAATHSSSMKLKPSLKSAANDVLSPDFKRSTSIGPLSSRNAAGVGGAGSVQDRLALLSQQAAQLSERSNAMFGGTMSGAAAGAATGAMGSGLGLGQQKVGGGLGLGLSSSSGSLFGGPGPAAAAAGRPSGLIPGLGGILNTGRSSLATTTPAGGNTGGSTSSLAASMSQAWAGTGAFSTTGAASSALPRGGGGLGLGSGFLGNGSKSGGLLGPGGKSTAGGLSVLGGGGLRGSSPSGLGAGLLGASSAGSGLLGGPQGSKSLGGGVLGGGSSLLRPGSLAGEKGLGDGGMGTASGGLGLNKSKSSLLSGVW